MQAIQVQISVDSKKEAERISRFLLEEKLASCVQAVKISTQYRWNDKIEKAEEYLLLIKTLSEKFEKIEEQIKKIHTYENPEIIGLNIDYISKEYLKWLEETEK